MASGPATGTEHSTCDRPSEAKKGEGRRVQSDSFRRCFTMRKAASRRSSYGSTSRQLKFALDPLCWMSGFSSARAIDMVAF